MSRTVEERIEKNKRKFENGEDATQLDLVGCYLQEIPEELLECYWIEELNLSNNKISDCSPLAKLTCLTNLGLSTNEISDCGPLAKLTSLQVLNLHRNDISNCEPLANLSSLISLNLSGNQIYHCHPLANLSNLQNLDLSFNGISNCSAFANLICLQDLDLSFNKISNCSSLSNLFSLENLDLEVNQIANCLPFENLSSLKELNLGSNQIYDCGSLANLLSLQKLILNNNLVSDCSFIKNLSSINELDLTKNAITSLPEWITDLNKNISYVMNNWHNGIMLYANPLKNPPVEIVQEGNEAIRNYFLQLRKEKGNVEYLFEAKLLLIGEGGTGKTTFAYKLQDANASMPDEKDTTFGIAVSRWKFRTSFSLDAKASDVNFFVNIWDFGGQKIYQGTHQIFFSDKSFYVLLADTREQKTDFSYWLNTVEQLSGENSSLVIILNKKFGHEYKLDESGIRSRFGLLIKEIIGLDLKNDLSKIIQLQEKIKTGLKDLPDIGAPLPPSWVGIRKKLSEENRNFISFDRFREICALFDIRDASMIKTLSGYFTRIGAFVHYIDDDLLCERIYLNSNWLVSTVYQVLDSQISKSRNGRLSEYEIKKIWSNNELHFEVNKLAQLMHKFGLMYHIRGTDRYVIPAHLPTVTPYDKWQHENENYLRFNYEFDKYMPQGIMSRLIVALHHHIKNQELVWHRGVNIEALGASAEIIESYSGTNRFEIRIAGSNKIELLAIIREHFAEVLTPFTKLQYKQLVPCICEICIKSSEPGFHLYNKLLNFKANRIKTSQCEKTGFVVNVNELLKITEVEPNHFRELKIFLASSDELFEDRKEFEILISRLNNELLKKGYYLKLEIWEDFINAMSKSRLQEEYNSVIKDSDIFISLFFSKVGKYTEEEFETAFGNFTDKGKPIIYTFFKESEVNIGDITNEINSLFDFKEKLKSLGHFRTTYKNSEDLKLQFKEQLEKLLPKFFALPVS